MHASALSIEAPRVENVMAAWPHHAAMQPCISGRAAVASTSSVLSFIAGSRHFATFVLISLHFKTICPTHACTIPCVPGGGAADTIGAQPLDLIRLLLLHDVCMMLPCTNERPHPSLLHYDPTKYLSMV